MNLAALMRRLAFRLYELSFVIEDLAMEADDV